MKRTIATLLSLSFGGVLLASPMRGDIGGDGVDYEVQTETEPLNTDYIRLIGNIARGFQRTNVNVGYGTGFEAGAKIEFDVTIEEFYDFTNTVFATFSGYGYMWCHLMPEENLEPGRYFITYQNQANGNIRYHIGINGEESFWAYATWWQLYDKSYPLSIGNQNDPWGWCLNGKFHNIKLYDTMGKLRHWWIPDPSGRFYDVLEGTFSTVAAGQWVYGDGTGEEGIWE